MPSLNPATSQPNRIAIAAGPAWGLVRVGLGVIEFSAMAMLPALLVIMDMSDALWPFLEPVRTPTPSDVFALMKEHPVVFVSLLLVLACLLCGFLGLILCCMARIEKRVHAPAEVCLGLAILAVLALATSIISREHPRREIAFAVTPLALMGRLAAVIALFAWTSFLMRVARAFGRARLSKQVATYSLVCMVSAILAIVPADKGIVIGWILCSHLWLLTLVHHVRRIIPVTRF